jgi:hypothetical protein
MNGVKTEGVHVIGEAAGTANPRDDHKVLARDAELGKHSLHSGENGVVTATGTPTHFLVGLKILFCKWRESGRGHVQIS